MKIVSTKLILTNAFEGYNYALARFAPRSLMQLSR